MRRNVKSRAAIYSAATAAIVLGTGALSHAQTLVTQYSGDTYAAGGSTSSWSNDVGTGPSASASVTNVVATGIFGTHAGVNVSAGGFTVPNSSTTPPGGLNSYTVAAVFDPTVANVTGSNTYQASSIYGYDIGGSGQPDLAVGFGGASGQSFVAGVGTNGSGDINVDSASVALNKVHTIIMQVSDPSGAKGAGTLSVYVDGALIDQQSGFTLTAPNPGSGNISPFGLGGNFGATPTKGILGLVQVYDDTAGATNVAALSASLASGYNASNNIFTFSNSGSAPLNAGTSYAGGAAPDTTGADEILVTNGGTGTVGTTDTFNVASIVLGNGTGTSGNITQNGGTVNLSGGMTIGAGGVAGTYTLNNGLLNLTAGNSAVRLIGSSGSPANLVIAGGAFNLSSPLIVGFRPGSVAVVNMSGGQINTNQTIDIGAGNGSNGTLIMSGGTINTTGQIWVADAADANDHTGGTGALIMNGGTIIANNWFAVGRGGSTNGSLTLNNGATVIHTQGGGNFEIGSYGDNNNTPNNGTLTINAGGTLSTGFIQDESPIGGTQSIYLNGGTLNSNNGDAGFIGGHTSSGDSLNVYLQAGGVYLTANTGGGVMGITSVISHSNLPADAGIPDGGVTSIGTGNITLSANNTFNGPVTESGASTLTLSGSNLFLTSATASGSGNLNFTGNNNFSGPINSTGTAYLVFTGTNNFTGTSTINVSNGGGLQYAADASLGTISTINLNNGQMINDNASQAFGIFITLNASRNVVLTNTGYIEPGWNGFNVAGTVSGTGNLSIPFDSGSLTLSGTNTYAGSTTIGSTGAAAGHYYPGASGVGGIFGLTLGNSAALPAGTALTFGVDPAAGDSAFTATLNLNSFNATVGPLSGGSNAIIQNTNTGSGSILTLGYNQGNSAALTSTSTATYAGVIRDTAYNSTFGSISVVKTGPGIQVLGGADLYSGSTSVNAGKLYLTGSSNGSSFTVASGATLGGSVPILNGNVVVAAGGNLEAGYLGTGSLNVSGGITMPGGSSFSIGNISNYPSTGAAGIITTGMNFSGGTIGVSVTSATLGLAVGNIYNIASFTSEIGTFPTFSILGALPSRALGTISNTSSGSTQLVQLTITQLDFLRWTGNVGGVSTGVWDNNTTADWTLNSAYNASGCTTYLNAPADTVVFDDTATGTTSVTLASTLSPNSVTFNNSSLTYTVSGAGGIGGLGGITKQGTGLAVLKTANTYLGSTQIQNGSLQLGTGGSIVSTSPVTLGSGTNAGTLVLGDSTGPVSQTLTSLVTSGTNTSNAVIGGSSSVSTLTLNIASSNTYAGVLGGSATNANNLALVKTGAGTLFLNGASTYSGGTTLNAGVLNTNNNSGLGTGPLTLTGSTTLQAGATIALANNISIGTSQLKLGTNGYNITLNGNITNTAINSPVITIGGNTNVGTVTLAGNLNVSGGFNQTNNPALFMNINNVTTNITGSGYLSGISMAWNATKNTLNLNPNGTLNITNTDTALDVGQTNNTAAGYVNQSGGIVNMSGNLSLGKWDGSYGEYNMNGGTLNMLNNYDGGNGNGAGNSFFLQNNGTVNVGQYTGLGQGGAGTNIYYLANGVYNNNGNSFALGYGTGSTDVATVAGGTLNVSGQSIVLSNGNGGAASTTIMNLDGGTTIANKIFNYAAAGTSILNFNGGTLKASASGSFLTGLNQANIYSGGAIIDTGANNITIGQNLNSAGGSLGLNTAPTITAGGSGYIGAPVVNITGGNGSGATAIAILNSTGAVSGIKITSPGTGYTGTPTFALAGGGGSGATVATYTPTANSADGGFTKLGTGTLTLSGSNTYTGSTQVQGGTVVVANSQALGAATSSTILSNGSVLQLTSTPANAVNFQTAGYSNQSNQGLTGFKPVLNGTTAQMTQNGTLNISSDVFYPNFISINNQTGFSASYIYNHTNTGAVETYADGVSFALQYGGSSTNPTYPGASVGYNGSSGNGNPTGFGPSFALGVEEYFNEVMAGFWNPTAGTANGGGTTQWYTPAGISIKLYGPTGQLINQSNDGSDNPTNPDLTDIVPGSQGSVPIISASSSIQVNINYAYNTSTGGVVTETLTSLTNGQTYTYVVSGVDLVAEMNGQNPAGNFNDLSGVAPYVDPGFTAATGGASDTITISNFQFGTSSGGTAYNAINISNPVQVLAGSTGVIQLAPNAGYSFGRVGPVTIQSGGVLSLTVGNNAEIGVTKGLLVTPSVTLSNAASGQLDIGVNGLDITSQNQSNPASSLHDVTAMVKSAYANGTWTGPGITSAAAAADTTHLTAVGVIQNSQLPTPYTSFMGASVGSSDVLVKYTYYGDANLDGQVTSTDYTLIDSGYLSHATGWANGDFNYDGVVNGSDYTLIDNAFNMQGVSLAAQIASPTGQIAGGVASAVPEPASLGLLAMGGMALLGRRRRR